MLGPETRRRWTRRGGSAAGAIEALEGRTLLSGGTDDLPPLTWTRSQAVVALPRMPSVSGQADRRPWATTVAHDLIDLDLFRADPRFAGIDGRGHAAVVIDTGIDRDDPFFGPDANRNGIADRIVYSYDFADGDSDASDVDGHGTNVSSLIAGADAMYGGVAPGANIIHLKVFPDDGGLASFAAVERALRWVVSNVGRYNIASVNLSLGETGNHGGPRTDPGVSDELARLAAMNVIVCAAAGNDFGGFGSAQGLSYPAADPSVLAVGAVYDRSFGAQRYGGGVRALRTGPDRLTPFTQRSAGMRQIFAPGAPATGAGPGEALLTQQGTSQAAPRVTGVALLMQQLSERIRGRRMTLEEFANLAVRTGERIVDGDDERDTVVNTGAAFRRVDIMAMAEALWRASGPEIRVTLAASATQVTAITSGAGRIAFGSTTMGTSIVKTFTIENTGAKMLRLSNLRAPAGFSVAADFSDRTVAPGESARFSVRLDGAAVGEASGEFTFSSNDRDERRYRVAVAGSTRSITAVLDDGSAGFAIDGAWATQSGGVGNDQRSRPADAAAGSATWTLSRLLPGTYRVWASWAAAPDLAPNARFSLSDGLGSRAARIIDQRSGPNDATLTGVGWEEIGTVAVKGGRLMVTLGGLADGRLLADAVRVERIGTLLGGGRLAVSLGTGLLTSDEGQQGFGSTPSGKPALRTLTLRNVGSGDLELGSAIVPPAGYSVARAPDAVLRPGTSTELVLRLDAGAPGVYAGTVVIPSTDWSRPEFGVNLTGTVSPMLKTIDDGESGFTTTGAWSSIRGGNRSDGLIGAPGSTAAWAFSGLTPGLFRIRATWAGGPGLDTSFTGAARFRLNLGDGTSVEVTVDQRRGPVGPQANGVSWQELGVFRVTAAVLGVELVGGDNGLLLADAVRLERLDN